MSPDRLPDVCPRCHVRSPVRLRPNELCADCLAALAWEQQDGKALSISRADLDRAWRKHEGEAAGEPRWRRVLPVLPGAVGLVLALLAGLASLELLRPRPIGPLAILVATLRHHSLRVLLLGGGAFAAGAFGLIRLHRSRHHHRVALHAAHLLPVVAGAIAGILGGLQLAGSGFDLAHSQVPPRLAAAFASPIVERIASATVVILAPDADGDARGAALGAGAVVAAAPDRAWVVTCSHVAMPYAAVGSFRDARKAHPLWVELADGRGAISRVRWTAPPPLDVALVEVPIADPPRPVDISPDSDALDAGSKVSFVANPLRDGWLVHHGAVERRESHRTPAGEYSLLFTDLPVQPGDSGTGLFDAQGQLVGLNTWSRLGGPAPRGISLPSEAMRAIVDAIARDDLDHLDLVLPEQP